MPRTGSARAPAIGTQEADKFRAAFGTKAITSLLRVTTPSFSRRIMPLLEDIKKTAEHLTGWHRPELAQLDKLVRKLKASTYQFRDDGLTPNNPRWPVIIYRRAVRFPRKLDPAAVVEDIFERNGWRDSWRDSIYDYLHYHSRIHEVLGVVRGSAQVRLGGDKGRTLKIAAGDVVVLPAGTGHQLLKANRNFLVVGAYPSNGTYDECLPDPEEHAVGVRRVKKVGLPRKDPLFGKTGALFRYWKPVR